MVSELQVVNPISQVERATIVKSSQAFCGKVCRPDCYTSSHVPFKNLCRNILLSSKDLHDTVVGKSDEKEKLKLSVVAWWLPVFLREKRGCEVFRLRSSGNQREREDSDL